MKIAYNDGTIRVEINESSYAWPVYMNEEVLQTSIDKKIYSPVSNDFVKAMLPYLKDKKVAFCDCKLTVDGQEVDSTSKTNLANAVFSFDNGRFKEIAELQALDPNDTQATETATRVVINLVDGKHVQSKEPYQRPSTTTEIVFDEEGVETALTVKVPVMIKSLLTQEKKDRLVELLAKT